MQVVLCISGRLGVGLGVGVGVGLVRIMEQWRVKSEMSMGLLLRT